MSSTFSPTPEQKTILAAINSKASGIVVAGPGTGKTRTAVEAAFRMAEGLPSDSARQVLFLSFSNAAIRRLATAAGMQFTRVQKRRLRFLTFHSLAAELLRFYGRFIDLPPKIRIADNLEERLIAIEANWQDDESDPAARLVALAKTEGILCFKSLIPLATKLLETSPELRKIISRRFPLIIVDEFQDTSEEQWKLLQLLGGASQVLAFGDPNQIIYSSLHAATERRMADFCAWKAVSPMALTLNHRCGCVKSVGVNS